MSKGLYDSVAEQAGLTPEAQALFDAHGSLTYSELAAQARLWAGAIGARGIVPGDRIAMLAPPGRESLICLLAADMLGAIWSGLDPRLRAEEIAFRLGDLTPKLVLTFETLGKRHYVDDMLAGIAATAPQIPLVLIAEHSGEEPAAHPGTMALAEFLASAPEPVQAVPSDPDRAAIIVYTSGSSGTPKGAMLSAPAMIDFAQRQNALWPVSPMRTLNFLPVSHVGAVVDLTIPTLVAGGCVVFQRKFDPLESLHLTINQRVSFLGSVPSTFIMQVALPEFDNADLSCVQLIAIEGAPIPPDLAERLLPIAPIATNYGMTESCSAITAMAPTRSVDELTTSVGVPFGDAQVRIDAQDGQSTGEILVRSPRNLLGYWNRPDATRDAFTDDGFFRTGDIGEFGADGRLRLRGRMREMYKSGGYNVYPAEIERAIGQHPHVEDVAVVAISDPLWQEVGVAFVTMGAGGDAAKLADALKGWCAEHLADYKRPKRFVLLDGMPLLGVGKVDRQALKQRAEALA